MYMYMYKKQLFKKKLLFSLRKLLVLVVKIFKQYGTGYHRNEESIKISTIPSSKDQSHRS